jgi:hypothetical protein
MTGLDPVIDAVPLARNADVLHLRHLVDARIKSGHDDL